jgi:hypothetical protein
VDLCLVLEKEKEDGRGGDCGLNIYVFVWGRGGGGGMVASDKVEGREYRSCFMAVSEFKSLVLSCWISLGGFGYRD